MKPGKIKWTQDQLAEAEWDHLNNLQPTKNEWHQLK